MRNQPQVTDDSFYEQGSKLLTPTAFQFILDTELRRAVRSRNSLTLVVLQATREAEGARTRADDGTVHEVGQVIGREIRDTDLVGRTDAGTLAVVLLDADADCSTRVIDRLVSRIERHGFPASLQIALGAACYPTHAVDAAGLTQQALGSPRVI